MNLYFISGGLICESLYLLRSIIWSDVLCIRCQLTKYTVQCSHFHGLALFPIILWSYPIDMHNFVKVLSVCVKSAVLVDVYEFSLSNGKKKGMHICYYGTQN